jgi:hypothetical protein
LLQLLPQGDGVLGVAGVVARGVAVRWRTATSVFLTTA